MLLLQTKGIRIKIVRLRTHDCGKVVIYLRKDYIFGEKLICGLQKIPEEFQRKGVNHLRIVLINWVQI